jgi:hypothetical protein
MADRKHQIPYLHELDDTWHSLGIPDLTRRLLRRDFDELVAEGFLPDDPQAAEDFISGYLWFEERRKQAERSSS